MTLQCSYQLLFHLVGRLKIGSHFNVKDPVIRLKLH